MRAFQFWVLLIISIIITFMIFKEISLSKALYNVQRQMTDNRETIDAGRGNAEAWKKLAVSVFNAGKTDPALMAILKNEHFMTPASEATNAPAAPSAPPASSKSPAPPAPSTRPAGQ